MSDQLGQLLGYFDNDGVTELVIHTGQPISVRIHGEYRAVTEGTVSKPQLAHLMLGTPLDALTPEDERNSEAKLIELAGRSIHALLIKRGKEIALTLATSVPGPAPIAYSNPLTKPASTRAPTPLPIPAAPVATRPPTVPPPPPTPPPIPRPSARGLTPAMGVVTTGFPYAPLVPRAPSARPPTSEPAEIHSTPPQADVLEGLPSGPPGLSLDLDDADDAEPERVERTESTSVDLSAPHEEVERESGHHRHGLPRAVSISGDVDGDMPELDSGLPRDVEKPTRQELPQMDAGWVPQLEPAIPRSATQERTLTARSATQERTATRSPIPETFVAPDRPTIDQLDRPAHPSQLVDEPSEVITILANIVRAARAANASDLHIAANRPLLIRTMSELRPLDPKAVTAEDAEAVLLPLLGPLRRKQLAERGYVDLAVDVPGAGRLRANISRVQGGLKGAFRLALPRPFTLDELGLPKEVAKVVSHHQGLVVIAGPSGHGKTTTLAALVDLVNSSRAHHILTVEDPVEIEHPRKAAVMSQREVGRHTKSFAAALKASLREDPDVIVIGELRDRETVEIAMTAAETGHLVLSTMSTPNAAKTIDRLIDMFPPDDQSQVRASLAGALRAIVAQRLVPTKDGKTIPAIELLTGVLPLAVLIRDNKLFQLPNLMQRGRSLGMIRLDESLIDHVRKGRISEEVALSLADSKKEMTNALRGPTSAIPKVTK